MARKIDERISFTPARIAVMTVSDTRDPDTDKSGKALIKLLEDAGHITADYAIIKDERTDIATQLNAWVADESVQIVLTTGGTGITGRDVTPEAVRDVIEVEIPGFGELFRMLSYNIIGTSTIQSRALAGRAKSTLIFALPGSPGACKDAWNLILSEQLDNRFRPCNFIDLLPRFSE